MKKMSKRTKTARPRGREKIRPRRSSLGRGRERKLTEEEIFGFIQDKAYRLWDEAGKPQGRDWEFWFRAEEKVKAHLKKIGKL